SQECFVEPSRSHVFGQRRHGRTRGSLHHAAESGWRSEAGESAGTYHEPAAHDQALHDICDLCRRTGCVAELLTGSSSRLLVSAYSLRPATTSGSIRGGINQEVNQTATNHDRLRRPPVPTDRRSS